MENNNPTIGPVSGHLLNALRSVEDARQSFYLAIDAIGGESMADQALAGCNDQFDAIRDTIEKELIDQVRDWASSPQRPAIV